ncbi:DNA repair exonuclease [Aestuariivirga sp.]|uniref:metallophosphoesterase family protein n=1 Tax=Aestuariivirga sp. TaxID=2650926 RepID=UPI0025BC64C9|nr:DNA repair exonuclease [Aestuariivirga sp.]MCA3555048.1 DNA repair exonuclease [Aestuariivirga sp.]
MRFIHTADWQIGKPFRNFGEKESVLRQARLSAIETIGRLALAEGAGHVLVAGDLYDNDAPAPKTLLEPVERMRGFPAVSWHVIPGNHDYHRGNGLWDRARALGLPENVRLHLTPEVASLGDDAVLLPAPLRRKSEVNDLTEWMDRAESAAGKMRIGLAHGSVTGFGGEGDTGNPIAPDRARRARLDYLGLGDWHRTLQIGPATWYAGTPEADRFNSQEVGEVLLVDIAGPGAPPVVTRRRTGAFRWLAQTEELASAADLDGLEARLRALPDLPGLLMRLGLKGTLDLTARSDLERRLSGLEAAMFWLEADLEQLHARPTLADLEKIDFDGVLREAAEKLKQQAENAALGPVERRRAGEALVQLYLLTRDSRGEAA